MYNVGDRFTYTGNAPRWKGAQGEIVRVLDYGARYVVRLTDTEGTVEGSISDKDINGDDPIKQQERKMWEALI